MAVVEDVPQRLPHPRMVTSTIGVDRWVWCTGRKACWAGVLRALQPSRSRAGRLAVLHRTAAAGSGQPAGQGIGRNDNRMGLLGRD